MGTTLEIGLAAGPEFGPEFGPKLDLEISHEFRHASDSLIHEWISESFTLAQCLDFKLSLFNSASDLSQLNRAGLGDWWVEPELAELLRVGVALEQRFPSSFRLAPDCSHRSPRFEVLEPRRFRGNCACPVDLGGIAKGAVVDRVYSELRERANGFEVAVNAGGDLRVSAWREVEVRVPARGSNERRYNLQLHGSAIATSTHRGENLTTGKASGHYSDEFQARSRAASVSVVAETCLWADALTKVAFHYDLGRELSAAEARDFGLRAVLCFDHDGVLIDAFDW